MALREMIPAGILEEDRHWWFFNRTKALLGILDRHLPHREMRILDVGCGAGNMIHHLSRYGRVVGLDNNPKPLAVARARGYEVHLGNGAAMPFPNEAFDLVAVLDVLEHCPDDLTILRECYRVCAPGGFLAATVPAFQWLWSYNDAINKHYRRYQAKEMKEKLSQVGFKIRRMSYNNFFVFLPAAAIIVLRRRNAHEPKLATPETDEEAYQVEMEPVPPILNALLRVVGGTEAFFLRYLNFPAGTSLLCLAEKR